MTHLVAFVALLTVPAIVTSAAATTTTATIATTAVAIGNEENYDLHYLVICV